MRDCRCHSLRPLKLIEVEEERKILKATSVWDLMNNKVCYVRPEQTVSECIDLFTEKRMRHLPTLDKEKLIGIVSIGDVVKQYIAVKEFTIQQLENHVAGSI